MYKTTQAVKSGRNGVRAARGIAVVNGYQVRFDSFQVEQNGFSAADSFSLTLPFFVRDQQQGDKILANGKDFESMLVNADVLPVQLYVGYPKNPGKYTKDDLMQLMDGQMDTTEWDFDMSSGEKVILHGRNAVGKMIDTKIIEKFPNLTASAIATQFATEHGLTPVVTPTTELAGTYYNQQSAVLGRETTEWDLLIFLAKQENFIVRVKGKQLFFGPYGTVVADAAQNTPGTVYDPDKQVYVIPYTWGYDIEHLHIERSPHAARDIEVIVITYDRNGKARIVERALSSTQRSARIAQQVGERAKYSVTYVIPGLTREQAQKRAQQILDELSRNQLIGSIQCAGNSDCEIDRQIEIYGVGQGLSIPYYLNKVTHKFSLSDAYGLDMSFSSQIYYAQGMEGDTSG